jgi:hypothetical protein
VAAGIAPITASRPAGDVAGRGGQAVTSLTSSLARTC